MYTNITHIALSYRHTLYIEVAHTNYLTSSLNIYAGKTLVDRKSTRLNSSHPVSSRMPSSA